MFSHIIAEMFIFWSQDQGKMTNCDFFFLLLLFYFQEEGTVFLYNENTAKPSDNIMDKWIQSFTQSLIQFFRAEMDGVT